MTAQEYYDAHFHEHVNEIDFAEGYALHALKDMVERLSERRKQVDGLKGRIKGLEVVRKPLGIQETRELVNQMLAEKISFSRFVELINEGGKR